MKQSSFNQIATDLNDVDQILKSMESQNRQDRQEQSNFVAPQTPVEKGLSDIWTNLLGINQVSTNDDFFKIGGNSLLATQAVSRIRKQFEIELSLKDFFGQSTIAMLAQHIEAVMSTLKDIESQSENNSDGDDREVFEL